MLEPPSALSALSAPSAPSAPASSVPSMGEIKSSSVVVLEDFLSRERGSNP